MARTKLTQEQKELNIKVAASEMFHAINEILFISVNNINAPTRIRQSEERFCCAMAELWKAFRQR